MVALATESGGQRRHRAVNDTEYPDYRKKTVNGGSVRTNLRMWFCVYFASVGYICFTTACNGCLPAGEYSVLNEYGGGSINDATRTCGKYNTVG